MTLSSRWRRAAAATVAVASLVPFAATAQAAGTETTKYQRSDFLQRALGVPANTVIDSVTYDRFQNLLRHTGNLAILIGDPATDPSFKAKAVSVDAAARAAGIAKVYWFNPNLTGGVQVGESKLPNLDIRNTEAIGLVKSSRDKYKDAWQNVVAQSLGNGVIATPSNPGAQSQSVTTTTGQAGAPVNDTVDPIFDYTTTTPANLTDSYFLVYNTEGGTEAAKDKIVSWVNLTDDAASATKVTAAIAGKTFARVDQFAWWKEEANERQRVGTQNTPSQNPDVPVLTDADNATADGGWRVNQITYPELVDLLDHSTDGDAAILFGGTWCPNTRAVLPFVNKEAQKNDVTVYNFDTVLDGGKVAGNPTGGANPLQTRNGHGNAGTGADANFRTFPSYVYGELVSQYLSNFQTEYLPTATNAITYFPYGDTSKTAKSQARLQVPYLFGYKAKGTTGPQAGITRQWIIKNANGTFREYMSNWYYTNPQQGKVSITFPSTVPAWQKINQAITNFTYKTDVTPLIPNRAIYTDTADYLINETATVGVDSRTGAVTVTSGGPTDISQPALTAALAALGANAPKTLTEARTAWLANKTDANLTTIAGAWGTVDARKDNVGSSFGAPTTPNSIAGGAAAKRALEVFFGGLPGGPRFTTRTVTANTVTAPAAPSVSLTIANPQGRAVTGDVTISVKQDATEVASVTSAISGGAASFALPALPAGTYAYTLTYGGTEDIDGFTESGTLTVNPAPVVDPTPTPTPPVVVPAPTATPTPTPIVKAKVSKVAGAIAKAPTSKKAGKYKVTITTAKGQTKASGKVTLKLTKGKTTKTVTGTLKNGTVTVTVPKLAKGTWKVAITWPGDSKYESGKATGTSIKVKK
ncbi:Ig-like domain-containing protein [Solirubrobacter phytolaccae]|uniref:Ig-like domain-containing protein n=1 Tax=Solirubrobacter phytolaccae TaxID=1404360 RepID=A0A9X3NLE7_9ACTN|nr:Ig-like domain-containing protein [Solirubrobacter phytolaccae]MDA0185741.1 Ig-like domain-containing protein [Solirubrobacter phytolaccae]